MTAEQTIDHMRTVYSLNNSQQSAATPTRTTDVPMALATNETNATASKIVAPIELVENFYTNNNNASKAGSVKIQVRLNRSGIYLRTETEWRNETHEQHLRIEDIIGSRFGTRLKKRARGGLSACKRNVQEEVSHSRTEPPPNHQHQNQTHHLQQQQQQNQPTSSQNHQHQNQNQNKNQHQNRHHQPRQQGDTDTDTHSAYLYIYAYVRSPKSAVGRVRTVRTLRFRSYDSFEENLKLAESWHRALRHNRKLAGCCAMDEKPLLILINPKSGSGKSRELFQKQVEPILKESETPYELHTTTHANYARELVRNRVDLEKCYCGIVVASGDGLFYEVLNGLMERLDWHGVCRQIPIGIIPCGSGNGIARSIAHIYNEPYEPKPILNATLTCLSGQTASMDIVRVELAKGDGTKPKEMYSVLSVGWGLIADVDIESEFLRSIGAPRFTLWTIHRLISLRTYRGKLSYLPWKEDDDQRHRQLETEMQTEANNVSNGKEPVQGTLEANHHIVESPSSENADVFEDAIDEDFFVDALPTADEFNYRSNINSWHSAGSRRTAYYSVAGQSVRSKQSVLSKLESMNAELEVRMPTPPPRTIPPLDMPLNDNEWTIEDGEFIMVHAAYTTHLSSDCFFAPNSRLNDGIIYLVVIRAGCSRAQLLQFLLGMSSGTHIPCTPHEHIQVIPVRAFRIEPSGGGGCGDGIMAVDGERVDYGPIQAEILPGIINVMVPHGGRS